MGPGQHPVFPLSFSLALHEDAPCGEGVHPEHEQGPNVFGPYILRLGFGFRFWLGFRL